METRKLSELWGIVLEEMPNQFYMCNCISKLEQRGILTFEEKAILKKDLWGNIPESVENGSYAWWRSDSIGDKLRQDFINSRIKHHSEINN